MNPSESVPIEIPLSDSIPPKDFTQSVVCPYKKKGKRNINKIFLI
jgi:hypothetical protein